MSTTTKNAQYTLKIKADSGYRSDESGRTDAECYRVALAALAGELGTDRNLLAAAPDLLEACETFSKWLAHDKDGFDCEKHDRSTAEGEAAWKEWWHGNLALCELAQQQAHAALAKARGES